MTNRVAVFVLAGSLAHWNAAARAGELPEQRFTPGAINSAISEQEYRAQCHAKGWTRLGETTMLYLITSPPIRAVAP
jgi:hypothetical protein